MGNQGPVPKAHWRPRKEIIIAFVAGTLVWIALIFAAHTYHWDLTTTTTTEVTQSPQIKVITTATGKTLLDWLQLLGILAIPIVVAGGTAVFTIQQTRISEANRQQQHDTDLQVAANQQHEELLRTYFDKLSELLLDEKLSTTPNIQSIVRARTLAALHVLNTERKTLVLRFLHDAGLLQYVKDFLYSLDLSKTDLQKIDLSHTNLHRANLSEAHLNDATLRGADLSGANLSGAGLSEAHLSKAHLSEAILIRAQLYGANLRGADLSRANLSFAHLSEAHLSEADLYGADLYGADLSKAHLDYTDLREANLHEANLSRVNLLLANLNSANLSGANLSGAIATPEQLSRARNVTREQLTQLTPLTPAAPQEAIAEQASTTPSQVETKPDQTSQEEAEQQEHMLPKQDIDQTDSRHW